MAPGRKSILPKEELQTLIRENWDDIYIDEKLIGPTHSCWHELAQQLSVFVSGRHLYTIVNENRYEVWPRDMPRSSDDIADLVNPEQCGDEMKENSSGNLRTI